jgi:hypothetical protein
MTDRPRCTTDGCPVIFRDRAEIIAARFGVTLDDARRIADRLDGGKPRDRPCAVHQAERDTEAIADGELAATMGTERRDGKTSDLGRFTVQQPPSEPARRRARPLTG